MRCRSWARGPAVLRPDPARRSPVRLPRSSVHGRRDRPPTGGRVDPRRPTAHSRRLRRSLDQDRSARPRSGGGAPTLEARPFVRLPSEAPRSPGSTSTPPGRCSIIRPSRRASKVAVGPRNSDHTSSTYGSVSRHCSVGAGGIPTIIRLRTVSSSTAMQNDKPQSRAVVTAEMPHQPSFGRLPILDGLGGRRQRGHRHIQQRVARAVLALAQDVVDLPGTGGCPGPGYSVTPLRVGTMAEDACTLATSEAESLRPAKELGLTHSTPRAARTWLRCRATPTPPTLQTVGSSLSRL